MNKYEILGRMKAQKVSIKALAEAVPEAPKTFKTHFENGKLDISEIKVMCEKLGIEAIDIHRLFFN